MKGEQGKLEDIQQSLKNLKRENIIRQKKTEAARLEKQIEQWQAEIDRLEAVRDRLLGERE